jgi:hypothetical protein
MTSQTIVSSAETGKLSVLHLKRYWHKSILKRNNKIKPDAFTDEWTLDITLLNALGLGLEQTVQYVYLENPSFEKFEDWVLQVGGEPNAEKILQFNQLLTSDNITDDAMPQNDKVLSSEDWDFWHQNGYVIIRNAVSKECCDEVIEALCDHINIKRHDPATWYNNHPAKQGIMVQLFQHPALEQSRKAFKIRKAFEEIWNRTDIWVNTDRVGFNPPETKSYTFQGPRLHWDSSITPPMPLGTQGILYLAYTAENQGAFTLVPGFHNKIEAWLKSLPAGADPRKQDMYALGAKPIAANAGDLIIWHHALPHGSSPNTSILPRFVQYINYEPADKQERSIWL